MKKAFDNEVEVICCGKAVFPDIEVNPLVGVLIKWECEKCGKIARIEIGSETIMGIVENILDGNPKIAFWNKEGDWLKEEKIVIETEKECEKRWKPTIKKMKKIDNGNEGQIISSTVFKFDCSECGEKRVVSLFSDILKGKNLCCSQCGYNKQD